jgi:hypothetical protein
MSQLEIASSSLVQRSFIASSKRALKLKRRRFEGENLLEAEFRAYYIHQLLIIDGTSPTSTNAESSGTHSN